MAEVKWPDTSPSRNFAIFGKHFPGIKKVQIFKELDRERTYPDGTEVRLAHNWLADLSLM